MNITQIKLHTDAITDEDTPIARIMMYANEALAYINTEFGYRLPFFTDLSTAYTGLNDSWLLRLVVNYVNYAVKMNDSSLNEAAEYKNMFLTAVVSFNNSASSFLATAYMPSESQSIYQMDTSNAIPIGWFGYHSKGGI